MPFNRNHNSQPPSHLHTRQGQEVVNAEPPPQTEARRRSKTKAKAEVDALQAFGKRLVEVGHARLDKLDISDTLKDAVREARKLNAFGAIRRQMQYIGKLMRELDETALAQIEELLAEIDGTSNKANARFHALEKLRERLLADEGVITTLKNDYPTLDVAQLRTLRRNALKEQAEQKPPKAYRAIFQVLKGLMQAEAADESAEASTNSVA